MPLQLIYGTGEGAGCSFAGGTFADGNAICDWGFRVTLTIDSTKVPADLTNYLLYVDLSTLPAHFFSNVKSDGGDIRVTKSDGTTEMAHYVGSIDTVGSTGTLWVRLEGTLSSSVDTDIYIYYGNAAASAYAVTGTYGRNNTFQNYEAFWDFEQDPSGSAPQLTDLTGNSASATSAGGMTSGDLIAGKVGKAWGFDNEEYASYDRFDVGTNNITIGGWARWATTGTRGIFGASRSLGANRYSIAQRGTAGNPLGYFFSTSTSDTVINGSTGVGDGNWKHLVMTVERSIANGVKGYLNGALDAQGGTPAATTISGSNNPIWRVAHFNDATGNVISAGLDLEGDVSVNYLRYDVLSADYITTEYANQNSPATFYTVGTPETA